jgi:asparagine synthase (glutamine-hydrolysing)
MVAAMTTSTGSRFLALSWNPTTTSIDRLTNLDRLTASWWRRESAGAALFSQREDFAADDDAGQLCGATRLVLRPSAREAHDPASLLRLLKMLPPDELRTLAPPFAVVRRTEQGLDAATDAFGVGQLFLCQAKGFAAVSNSASLMGRLFDCELDQAALVGYAVLGAFQENDTPFRGVAKVPAGHAVQLRGAEASLRPYFDTANFGYAPEPGAGSLAEITRQVMDELSEAVPQAELELSGGVDSRMMLAGLSPSRRRNHRALTIGPPDSPDVLIASQLAARCGLDHRVIPTQNLGDLGREELQALLAVATETYDNAANPIDKAALVLVNQRFPSAARFSGQNGEILRGFYYPGQPLARQPSEDLAQGLLRWRLVSNECVDPRLFAGGPYGELRARAETRVVRQLAEARGPWWAALDRYYLYERMQRWVGNSASNTLGDRTVLYPFFDPRFVGAALAAPGSVKLNSRAAFQLLANLDADLAAQRLDSGLQPLAMSRSLALSRLEEGRYFLQKVAKRTKRVLSRGQHVTLGATSIVELWGQHGLNETLPVAALQRTGLFDDAALESVATGTWLPNRATLGFLLMISGLVTSQETTGAKPVAAAAAL